MKTIRFGLAALGILCATAAFADTSHHAKYTCTVRPGDAPIAAKSAQDCRRYQADASARFENQSNEVDPNTISAGFR